MASQDQSRNESMASASQSSQGQPRELPESIKRLRQYTSTYIPSSALPPPSAHPPLSSSASSMRGPYARSPPIYVGKMNRKDLARKNRIQTAMLGLGLTSFVLGIYGYAIWKKLQLGIDDRELIRMEREALQLVESGEIDLELLEKKAADAKHHKY